MAEIYRFLERHGIAFERHDHPAVFTVEEASKLVPPLPGIDTKNLFLRDEKATRHILVVAPASKKIDLKSLGSMLGTKRLSFGSADRLGKILGVEPGSVSILALVNDAGNSVELVIDEEVWKADFIQCHPLANTSTLVVSAQGIRKFLEATGHAPRIVAVPRPPAGDRVPDAHRPANRDPGGRI